MKLYSYEKINNELQETYKMSFTSEKDAFAKMKELEEHFIATGIDETAQFVEDINKLRLEHKNKWYTWSGVVNGKNIEIKGFGTWLQIFRIDGKNVSAGMDISVKEFKSLLENSLRKYSKVEAGPGAGVTVNLSSFRVPFCVKNGVAKFEPVLVDVEFHSAYDTQKAEEGLFIQLEDVNDPEVRKVHP